ncbi:MAG TPA: hypothetical protein VKI64_05400 [Acidimicrobiales bacterium]|nr:hypothetical protein [Acidimicrobiales bacterium]
MGVVDGTGWLKARTRHLQDQLEKASNDEERAHIRDELEQLKGERRRGWLSRLLPFLHG